MIDYKVIIAADVARVSAEYAGTTSITRDEAMRLFLGSATYRALSNVETGLCYEMYEAIYELFIEEMKER